MTLNKTIGFRLLRLVFGCYFAISVVVTSVQLVAEYQHTKDNIFFELSHLANTLEESLARSMWNYNIDQVEATLLGISKIAIVTSTRVTNTDRKVVAVAGLELEDSQKESVVLEENSYGKGKIYKFNFPVGADEKTLFEYEFPIYYVDDKGNVNELIGYAHIFADHAVILDRVAYGFFLIIVNSLIKTLALWFVFLYFTKRVIAKPLGALTQAARALDPSDPDSFRQGDKLERLENHGRDDELQILTDTFVKMRTAIIEKIDVIEGQNSSLEQRVAQRTAKLSRTNKELEQEIDQRKRAEESLRIYREIILNTDEAIIVTDPNGIVIEVNPAYEKNFDQNREDIIGSKQGILGLGESDIDIEREMWASIRECGNWRSEFLGARKNGDSIQLWVAVSTIYDANGEIQFLIGLLRDVSELKQTEAMLSQAQKLESIGQLAAGVAHEINTPTQFVGDNIHFLDDAFKDLFKLQIAYGKLLDAARKDGITSETIEQVDAAIVEADSEYLNEEIPTAIEQSIDGVQRIAKIVGAMKTFSHMGSNSKELTDLNTAITNTVTVARNEWKYFSEVDLDLDRDLPRVPCFPAEFNQVLLNLVVNAAHAIKESIDTDGREMGLIKISSRQLENEVEIRVQDNGSGIPESIRDKILDPFFTTKEVGKGTGQGLSIVHSTIVEKHGGRLHFESQTGVGTTFVIILPLEEDLINQNNVVASAG